MAKIAGNSGNGYQKSETGTVILIEAQVHGGTGAIEPVGRATSAVAEIQFGTQPVYGIGVYLPYEYVFMRYSGQLTIEGVRMRKTFRAGNMVSKGIVALGEDVLSQGDTTISISDKYTQETLAAYLHCTPVSYNLTVREGQLVTEQAVFNFTNVKTTGGTNFSGVNTEGVRK